MSEMEKPKDVCDQQAAEVEKKNTAKGRGSGTKRGKKNVRQAKKPSPEAILAAEAARREENITIGICPFFKQDRGYGRVSCEGASFHFPDREARREFVYRFCAHPDGYKECPLQLTLEHYYERKYAHHE